ncbi:MAG TPA: GAF domain-containing protein [Verrucomicrobiae bacterium]|nr:GAF domain-containing protein [Verrucomicrobiae bacterium]
MERKVALAELKRLASGAGVRACLEFLNGLTSHRFTALYRFDETRLKNLFFFDRQHPDEVSSPEVPVLSSYCVFVRDSGKMFSVKDSQQDERTLGHPKRLEIRAYIGVPLLDVDGKMFGTICHFDVDPRPINPEDIDLMERLADVIHPQVEKLGK